MNYPLKIILTLIVIVTTVTIYSLISVKHTAIKKTFPQMEKRRQISTKKHNLLPDQNELKRICKAISVLDAILSQEWEFRYYSYNSNWADDEEFFEMRNGEGDQLLILFREDGCIMNGFAHEYEQQEKSKLTDNLPLQFNDFIFGEPVASIGTTFCLWTTDLNNWQTGKLDGSDDNSAEMLAIFDGKPQTYIDWASEYFEDSYTKNGLPLEIITKIYNGETLTKSMVLSIVDELEDWNQLESDLQEIDYPFDLK